MLLDLRSDLVRQRELEAQWTIGIKAWAWANRSPTRFALSGQMAALGSRFIPTKNLPEPLSGWTKHRDFPEFAPRPFQELWEERKRGGNG